MTKWASTLDCLTPSLLLPTRDHNQASKVIRLSKVSVKWNDLFVRAENLSQHTSQASPSHPPPVYYTTLLSGPGYNHNDYDNDDNNNINIS